MVSWNEQHSISIMGGSTAPRARWRAACSSFRDFLHPRFGCSPRRRPQCLLGAAHRSGQDPRRHGGIGRCRASSQSR